MKLVLITTLTVLTVGYAVAFARHVGPRHDSNPARGRRVWLPTPLQALIGFVTNFFDTLGIGNFAPTTAWFRHARVVPDERIPGTLNAGHTLPVMLMAFLFIDSVAVEPVTLTAMIAAAVVGAWLGAGVVAGLPRRRIQLGMGIALLAAALLIAAFQLGLEPSGSDALGLAPARLVPACVTIAALGALMTIGVGLYAPCMILVSLLGMNPVAAFPIMMGACAFLMPFASLRFLSTGKLHARAALGLTLGGLPAVLIAALIVKSLPLDALKWLVVVVVTFTAVQLLRSARWPEADGREPAVRTPREVP